MSIWIHEHKHCPPIGPCHHGAVVKCRRCGNEALLSQEPPVNTGSTVLYPEQTFFFPSYVSMIKNLSGLSLCIHEKCKFYGWAKACVSQSFYLLSRVYSNLFLKVKCDHFNQPSNKHFKYLSFIILKSNVFPPWGIFGALRTWKCIFFFLNDY